MKKMILLIGIMLFLLPGIVCAEGTEIFGMFKDLIPSKATGGFYNFVDSSFSLIIIGELLEKDTKYGTIALDAGYGESNLGVAGISYKTETLEKLGVNVVVLKDLFAKIGYGCGIDGITDGDKRFAHGPMVTFGANFKF